MPPSVPYPQGSGWRSTRSITRGPDDAILAVDSEVGFAGDDREALLLVRMDALDDRSAGPAAPLGAHDL